MTHRRAGCALVSSGILLLAIVHTMLTSSDERHNGEVVLDSVFADTRIDVAPKRYKDRKKLPSINEMMEQMREMIAHATNTPIKPWKAGQRTFSSETTPASRPQSASDIPRPQRGSVMRATRTGSVKLPNSVIYGSRAGYQSLVQSVKQVLATSEKNLADIVEDVQGYISHALSGGGVDTHLSRKTHDKQTAAAAKVPRNVGSARAIQVCIYVESSKIEVTSQPCWCVSEGFEPPGQECRTEAAQEASINKRRG
eukprot:754094-Hanusia_phi.AAC.2